MCRKNRSRLSTRSGRWELIGTPLEWRPPTRQETHSFYRTDNISKRPPRGRPFRFIGLWRIAELSGCSKKSSGRTYLRAVMVIIGRNPKKAHSKFGAGDDHATVVDHRCDMLSDPMFRMSAILLAWIQLNGKTFSCACVIGQSGLRESQSALAE